MAAAVVAVAPRGKQLDHFDAECDAVVKEAANLVRAAFYHMPPQIPPGPPKDPNKPRCNIGAKFKGGLLDVAKEAVDFLDEVKKILPPEVTANFLGVVPRGVTRRKEAMADVDRRPGHAYCRNCFMDRTEGRIVKEFVKKGASKRNVRFVWTEPNQVYVDRATVAVVPAKRKSKKKAKKKSKSSSSSSSAREVAHIVTVVAPQPEPAAKEKKPLFRNRLFKVNPNPDKALPPQKKK
jgi:hypothetical protein